ncbi:MAG: PEP/pyruvate-binding domain-containing protein [Gammaproteobacteria bacterium]
MHIFRFFILSAVFGLALGTVSAASSVQRADQNDTAEYRELVESMKTSPRGPFSRIRWFCNDGTVLPPKAYACQPHGGGVQHGEWSADTQRIRAAGYPIANVLAGIDPTIFDGPDGQRALTFVLIEQFLEGEDDGWIFRNARYYRGAYQYEEEVAGAQNVLEYLVAQDEWRDRLYPLLVEAVHRFPEAGKGATAGLVRELAASINDRDPGFGPLRNKIHGKPEPTDAQRVRDYAQAQGKPELQEQYERLASAIDELAVLPTAADVLESIAAPGPAGDTLRSHVAVLRQDGTIYDTARHVSESMVWIRQNLDQFGSPAAQVAALRGMDLIGDLALTRGITLWDSLEDDVTRDQTITLLGDLAGIVYGLGFITDFEYQQFNKARARVQRPEISLVEYRAEIEYLSRLPVWTSRRLAFYFEEPIRDFVKIEPKADRYIPHRLRGSPVLVYSELTKSLAEDAALLANIQHVVFDTETSSGYQALNPGIAEGVIRTLEELESLPGQGPDTIVIVPETVAELPAVAGILTENEGNILSHVQLLARNLGVPNVVVRPELMPEVTAHLGERARLEVSPGGIVRLTAANPATAQRNAEREPEHGISITVDVDKLDLETDSLIPTSELRQSDSGVRVGPKAAQLGKLTAVFPDHVSPGLALPFGAFRNLLDQPGPEGDRSAFEWMKAEYEQLASIPDAGQRAVESGEVLQTLRDWIKTAPLDPAFLEELRIGLAENFGADGTYGVFVRSDTNVEDLAGFTGAGLNLTVPNVVGYDNIVEAIRDVWASPFTERSYGWRQALMENPEHVYAAVLLHKSVNNDKSGVLITTDAATGDRGYLSVVGNEGVGGGVEGQTAESLRVRVDHGDVRLLSSVTAPRKRVLLTEGGSELVPAEGPNRLLTDANLDVLRAFTQQLPGWFQNLPEDQRANAVADVEFGFHNGKLLLFQIRPFNENKSALTNPELAKLDTALANSDRITVSMNEPPETSR